MKRWRKGWWVMAALPLLGLPLVMREVSSQEAAAPPAPAEQRSATSETAKPAAPATPAPADVAEPPAADEGEEKVSADNNLSFPVDI